ncbi:Trm112 family protein [Candidatus Profftia tarda]|nr:Trm112 family protein [Candidatus Profftia tarda]
MDSRLLEIIVCPKCKGALYFNESNKELICTLDRLGYPVRYGIPVLLEKQARLITTNENN